MNIDIALINNIYKDNYLPNINSSYLLEASKLDNFIVEISIHYDEYEVKGVTTVHSLIYKDKLEEQISNFLSLETHTISLSLYKNIKDIYDETKVETEILEDIGAFSLDKLLALLYKLCEILYKKFYITKQTYNLYRFKYPFSDWPEELALELIQNISKRNIDEDEVLLYKDKLINIKICNFLLAKPYFLEVLEVNKEYVELIKNYYLGKELSAYDSVLVQDEQSFIEKAYETIEELYKDSIVPLIPKSWIQEVRDEFILTTIFKDITYLKDIDLDLIEYKIKTISKELYLIDKLIIEGKINESTKLDLKYIPSIKNYLDYIMGYFYDSLEFIDDAAQWKKYLSSL